MFTTGILGVWHAITWRIKTILGHNLCNFSVCLEKKHCEQSWTKYLLADNSPTLSENLAIVWGHAIIWPLLYTLATVTDNSSTVACYCTIMRVYTMTVDDIHTQFSWWYNQTCTVLVNVTTADVIWKILLRLSHLCKAQTSTNLPCSQFRCDRGFCYLVTVVRCHGQGSW